jgi:hypothetical protein
MGEKRVFVKIINTQIEDDFIKKNTIENTLETTGMNMVVPIGSTIENTIKNDIRNTSLNTINTIENDIENTRENTSENITRNTTIDNTSINTINTIENTRENDIGNTSINTIENTIQNTIQNDIGNTSENITRNTTIENTSINTINTIENTIQNDIGNTSINTIENITRNGNGIENDLVDNKNGEISRNQTNNKLELIEEEEIDIEDDSTEDSIPLNLLTSLSNIKRDFEPRIDLQESKESKYEIIENEIQPFEREFQPEWFLGQTGKKINKTPERYMKIRNHIIGLWKTLGKNISKSRIRPGLKGEGDVNAISRVHSFLESINAINNQSLSKRQFNANDSVSKRQFNANDSVLDTIIGKRKRKPVKPIEITKQIIKKPKFDPFKLINPKHHKNSKLSIQIDIQILVIVN